MKVDLGIWNKLTWVVIALGFVAGLLLVGAWYYPLLSQNERLRKQILKLGDQIQQEAETSKALKASIDALNHDPKTVERLARETLSYAKPGETVIRFDRPATNTPVIAR
jgi:cell division protein FtsB